MPRRPVLPAPARRLVHPIARAARVRRIHGRRPPPPIQWHDRHLEFLRLSTYMTFQPNRVSTRNHRTCRNLPTASPRKSPARCCRPTSSAPTTSLSPVEGLGREEWTKGRGEGSRRKVHRFSIDRAKNRAAHARHRLRRAAPPARPDAPHWPRVRRGQACRAGHGHPRAHCPAQHPAEPARALHRRQPPGTRACRPRPRPARSRHPPVAGRSDARPNRAVQTIPN
jgi:hypothetical protein